ncbi:DUF6907 domain-containing protein [Streptomyces sp. NPDC101175]|uniref:DUF6907 domain-containing protein n=1 Tax=Streptomyces sp. NPDC101175 TaxID=3366123 RepID=UPI003836EF1B
MSEQERAQTPIERHFPVTAAFLAAEPAEGPAPVFGSGAVQNAQDDQPEPHVIVRVAYRLSRWELLAALADGYATTNTGQNPDDMTVAQIRDDVEAYLCGASWRDTDALIEQVAGQIERGEHPEQMAALLRAMDRAYPLHREEPPTQSPRYGDGTVTLLTSDRGEVTVDEPAWCIGHDDDLVGYYSDITHNGRTVTAPIVTARYGASKIMSARVSHAPHAVEQPEPFPLLSVELDAHGDLDPADGHNLARALRLAAVRVEREAAGLEALRRTDA